MANHILPAIACPECDLLQREIYVPPGGTVCCLRCGAMLYRNAPDSIERTFCFAVTAAILFVFANSYPIVGIELQGNRSASNLYGALEFLWRHDMKLVAFLVGTTTILVPAIELTMLIYLLVSLRFKRTHALVPLILQILRSIEPWGMVEVLMLGILVSLVKLTHSFNVIVGVSLWSFVGLTLMLTAVAASFNPRDIWTSLDMISGKEEGS